MEYFRSDAVITPPGIVAAKSVPERAEISEFSDKSRRRLAFTVSNTDAEFRSMLTLTYKSDLAPKNGKEIKRHLNSFLTWWRSRFPGVDYVWFMEFTRKGIPHFHALVSTEVHGPHMKMRNGSIQNLEMTRELSTRWAKITGNPGTKMEEVSVAFEVIREPEGAARYVNKYAYKTDQKTCPESFRDCGRFWGASKGVKPIPRQTEKLTNEEIFESGFLAAGEVEGRRIPYRIQFGKGLNRFGRKE